ncbi:MAG: type II secretion system minor pseudopilin GspJ [Alphaproteobacteria bacterium]
MMPAQPSTSGFTLVEMLVALVIFALLSTAGVGILRASVDTQAAVEERLGQIGGLGRLYALLSSDLGQAVDRPTRSPSGDRPAFEGDARGMRFVRLGWANIDQEARSDLQRVEWQFEDRTLARTGFKILDGGNAGARAAPIARNLAAATLRYRMPDGSWAGSFRSTDQTTFPAAVELTITPVQGAPVVMVFSLPQGAAPSNPGAVS